MGVRAFDPAEGPLIRDPASRVRPFDPSLGPIVGDKPDASVGDVLKEVGASAIESVGEVAHFPADLASVGINKVFGTDLRAMNPLQPLADSVRNTMTPGGRAARADPFKGDIISPSSWEFPQTGSGLAMGVAQGVGSLGSTMLPLGALKVAGMAEKGLIRAGSFLGATSTGGQAATQVRDELDKLKPEDWDKVPAYRAMVDSGVDPYQAKRSVSDNTSVYAGVLSSIFGAVQGGINGKLLEDVIEKKGIMPLLGRVSKRATVRGAVAGGVGAVGEGIQEGMEQAGQNVGENLGRGDPAFHDVTRDTFGNVVMGAIVGGAIGGPVGAIAHEQQPGAQFPPGQFPGPPAAPAPQAGPLPETPGPPTRSEHEQRVMDAYDMRAAHALNPDAPDTALQQVGQVRTDLDAERALHGLAPLTTDQWGEIVDGLEKQPGQEKKYFPFISAEAAGLAAERMEKKTGEPWTVSLHPSMDRYIIHPASEAAPTAEPGQPVPGRPGAYYTEDGVEWNARQPQEGANAADQGTQQQGGVEQREGSDAGLPGEGQDRNEPPGQREEGTETVGGDRPGQGGTQPEVTQPPTDEERQATHAMVVAAFKSTGHPDPEEAAQALQERANNLGKPMTVWRHPVTGALSLVPANETHPHDYGEEKIATLHPEAKPGTTQGPPDEKPPPAPPPGGTPAAENEHDKAINAGDTAHVVSSIRDGTLSPEDARAAIDRTVESTQYPARTAALVGQVHGRLPKSEATDAWARQTRDRLHARDMDMIDAGLAEKGIKPGDLVRSKRTYFGTRDNAPIEAPEERLVRTPTGYELRSSGSHTPITHEDVPDLEKVGAEEPPKGEPPKEEPKGEEPATGEDPEDYDELLKAAKEKAKANKEASGEKAPEPETGAAGAEEEGAGAEQEGNTGEFNPGPHEGATSPDNDKREPTEGEKEAGNYPKDHDTIAGMPVTVENAPGSMRFRYAVDRIREVLGLVRKERVNAKDRPTQLEAERADVHLVTALEHLTKGDPAAAVTSLKEAVKALKRSFASMADTIGSVIADGWHVLMRDHYGYIRGTVGPDKDHIDVFVKVGTRKDHEGPVFVVDQNKPDGKFDEPKIMLGYATAAEARAAYLAAFTDPKAQAKNIRAVTATTTEGLKAWIYDKEATKHPFAEVAKAARARALNYLHDRMRVYVETGRDSSELFKSYEGSARDEGQYTFRGGHVQVTVGDEEPQVFTKKEIESAWQDWVEEAKATGRYETEQQVAVRKNIEAAKKYRVGQVVGVIHAIMDRTDGQGSIYMSGQPLRVVSITPEEAILEVRATNLKDPGPYKVTTEPRWIRDWHGGPTDFGPTEGGPGEGPGGGGGPPTDYGPYKGKKVTIERTMKNGEKGTITIAADRAMKGIDDRIKGMEALRECLG